MLTALVGLARLLAILWLAAQVLAGGHSLSPRDHAALWKTWGLACAEGLAWGVLCSLLIPRPLWATLMAALSVFFADVTLGWPDRLQSTTLDNPHAMLYRTTALVVVVMADSILLPSWLLGRELRRDRRVPRVEPAWRRTMRHLAWQTIKEGWISLCVLVGVGLLSCAITLVADEQHGWLQIAPVFVLLAAAMGGLVFRADQSHGPRFLAQRAASPWMIWSTRHLVWGAALLVLAGLVLVPPAAAQATWVWKQWRTGQFGAWVGASLMLGANLINVVATIYVVTASVAIYAAGQLASLVVRRSLLSMTLALLLGALMAVWMLLAQWIGASSWWSVWPLAIGFLLATYLRMPGWLIERGGLRAWIGPLAAALVPVAALMVVVPVYRVGQIPRLCPACPRPVQRRRR